MSAPERACPVVAAVICAAVIAVGCGSSSNDSTSGASSGGADGSTQIRMAIPAGSFLDIAPWIAQEKGYFKQSGLDVKTTIPTIPFSQLPAALGGTFDVILGTQPDIISASSEGVDIVAISGVNRNTPRFPGAALVVPAGSPIKSVKDLKGKSIGTPSVSGNNWLSLLCWAQRSGVDPNSIRGVTAPAPQLPDQLRSKRFDGALIFQPLLNTIIKGGGVNLGDSYKGCFSTKQYTALLVAKGSWAESHKPVIAKLRAALTKARAYMIAHPEEARAMYVERSGLPKPVASAAPIDSSALDFGAVTPQDLQPWLGLMKSLRGFRGKVDLHKLAAS